MTIAACAVTSEGVVLGADSTATMSHGQSFLHYNHAQKLMQVGDVGSTLGFVSWGLGGLRTASFRTMVADLSDDLISCPPQSVLDTTERWVRMFWPIYNETFAGEKHRCQQLATIKQRTAEQEAEFMQLTQLSGGFCFGGRVATARNPSAYEVHYNPLSNDMPKPQEIKWGVTRFWGCPNMLARLLHGCDHSIANRILNSGLWKGTPEQLAQIIEQHVLSFPGEPPIREAIDWVFSAIYITIKAMKFSKMARVCGGPIEVAVITTDRPFRWVCHKRLGEAISFPAIGD